MIIASFLIVNPKDNLNIAIKEKDNKKKDSFEPLELSPLEMIKRPSFWFLFSAGTFLMFMYMAIISGASYIVIEVNPLLEKANIATIVGLISIFNAIGRVLSGIISDSISLRFNIVFASTFLFVSTIFVGLAVLSMNTIILIISFILFGVGAGLFTPCAAIVTQKFYGLKHFQINLQVVMLSGMVNALGATLLGFLSESFGTFSIPIFIISLIGLIGYIGALLLKRP